MFKFHLLLGSLLIHRGVASQQKQGRTPNLLAFAFYSSNSNKPMNWVAEVLWRVLLKLVFVVYISAFFCHVF